MSTANHNPGSSGRSIAVMAIALLGLAVVIAVGSLLYGYSRDAGAEFGGADGQAEEVITEIHPSYEPWFAPLIGELPGEVESGLFAIQAGLGGIILGGAIGWYAGRHRGRKDALAPSAPDSAARE